MMGAIGRTLVAGLAMAASALPAQAVGDLSTVRFIPDLGWTRTRSNGRHNPAGTKLARKAARGLVGLATIR
jgi:hypothetical protein